MRKKTYLEIMVYRVEVSEHGFTYVYPIKTFKIPMKKIVKDGT